MFMLYQFHRWIITLGAEVRALHSSTLCEDTEELRKDIARCESELQHLYAYAAQQNIDLTKYYHPFAEIEARLLLLHKCLTWNSVDNS
jgi:hypothetical protein